MLFVTDLNGVTSNTAFSNTKQTGLSYTQTGLRCHCVITPFFFHFIEKDYLTINCHSSQI